MKKMARLWIEDVYQGFRINGERPDGSLRTAIRRTNTRLAAEAELVGLARGHGLTVDAECGSAS